MTTWSRSFVMVVNAFQIDGARRPNLRKHDLKLVALS
jgi:hypothetical protein